MYPGKVRQPHILIVDDDEYIQSFVGGVLECFDYELSYAGNITKALVLLEQNQPDLILLDIHLIDATGFDLLKIIEGKENLKEIPVLIMTGDLSKETINESYQFNIYDFIEKPVHQSLLIKRVESALAKKQLNNELHKKEKRIIHMQHLAGMGFWEYDSEIDNVTCSDEMCSILGLKKEEADFNLHSFLAHTHDEDVDMVSEVIHNAIKSGHPYAIEHRIYDDDGYETIVLHQGEITRKDNPDYYKINATMTDITERKNAQDLIEYTSFYDKLTELPNRIMFCNRMSALMDDNDKNSKLMGVVFIGIDRFKNINDSLGHSIGDELLIKITERFKSFEDIEVARFSGDVFSLAIPDMSTIDGIVYEISQIQSALSEPFNVSGHELYITVSIGVSVYPLHYGGKDELINNAESAMHYSKNSGGNRISSFDKQMTVTGKRRLFIETDLRKAIDKEQFEVFYQPQVSVHNRRLIGMEALIRWNHPEHGLISPDDFIPVAEETGLIVPIGQWVLETATRQVAEWINNGYGLLRVGVNLSAMQFENTDLVKDVENALSRSGLLPCSLDLEVTESSAMRDVNKTISILNTFSEMGVQTSLDDFGTGYSSLSYLKMMPLSTLKIDREFVKDITANGENGELARMIISMCHTLGLNVIAEGVETEEHMQFLAQHECIEAQGYLFSPPVDKVKFEGILNQFSESSIEYTRPDTSTLLFT